MKKILGIDPGLSGGLAVVGSDLSLLFISAMPRGECSIDQEALYSMLLGLKEGLGVEYCLLEKVASRPAQSSVATFTFGQVYGITQAMLTCVGIPWELVRPQEWMATEFKECHEILKDNGRRDTKAMSKAKCLNLYPLNDLRATPRSKKPHDGICDALLIARYGALKA